MVSSPSIALKLLGVSVPSRCPVGATEVLIRCHVGGIAVLIRCQVGGTEVLTR